MQGRRGTRGRTWEAGRRWGAAAAIAGSLAICADEASASLSAPGSVRDGHNVSVFHEIDFVATFGHRLGESLRVEVFRGPHRIARASGPALSTPEGPGLEVNHGPAGLPREGDCWSTATADIRPYDRIVVTDAAGGTDTILVDDIEVDAGPMADPAAPDDVVLVGHARSALGGPVTSPLEGEFRLTSKLRGVPDHIDYAGESFKAVFTPPYRMDPAKGGFATKFQLLDPLAEHTIGFGHTFPFATGETQIADAAPAPGPALGCEGLAPGAPDANAATSADRDVVGPGAGLAVSGTATGAVTGVTVTLDDGPGGGNPVTATTTDVDLAPNAPATADRGWAVQLTPADLAGFPAEAQLTATPAFTGGGAATGPPLRVRRDTVAPAAPQATPGPGRHEGTQFVDLSAEAGAAIHFTTDGSAPTAASPRFGPSIVVDRTTTIRAIAIDAGGNVSAVATLAFTIVAPGADATTAGPAAAQVVPLVVAQPAGVTIADPPLPAVTLRVARLTAPARLTARRARRTGLVAFFVAPRGAEYAEARLYRVAGARRTLLGRRPLAVTPGRREVARFTSAAVRAKLNAGRYVIEIRTGPALGRLGPAVTKSLRVTR